MQLVELQRNAFCPGEDISANITFSIETHDKSATLSMDQPGDEVYGVLMVNDVEIVRKLLTPVGGVFTAVFTPSETASISAPATGAIVFDVSSPTSSIRRFVSGAITIQSCPVG